MPAKEKAKSFATTNNPRFSKRNGDYFAIRPFVIIRKFGIKNKSPSPYQPKSPPKAFHHNVPPKTAFGKRAYRHQPPKCPPICRATLYPQKQKKEAQSEKAPSPQKTRFPPKNFCYNKKNTSFVFDNEKNTFARLAYNNIVYHVPLGGMFKA